MEKTIKIQRILNKNNFTNAEIEPNTGAIVIRSAWRGRIPGHTRRKVKTGTAFAIPEDCVGMVISHDDLLNHYPLKVIEQTIDHSCRDELQVIVTNYSAYPENLELNQVLGRILIVPKAEIKLKPIPKLKKISPEK